MCTPWTIRWRVKDWATCLFACKFPLDEEPETFCSSSPQELTRRTTRVYNPMGDTDTKRQQINENAPRSKRCKEEKRSEESIWPRFADEDYIVFCFREDGEVHVLHDVKSQPSDPVDHFKKKQVIYGENAEIQSSSYKDMVDEDIDPTNEKDSIRSYQKSERKESIFLDTQMPSFNFRDEGEDSTIEEAKESKMVSLEISSDSNQSDSSTASFAFPVMRWEWVGSPVHMPQSDGLHLRKHRGRSVRLRCCRF